MNQKLQLVIPNQSPAICHAAKIFFEDICGFSLIVVSEENSISDAITIVYDVTNSTGNLFLKQQLFPEKEFTFIDSTIEIDKVFFPFANKEDSLLPFDPIALAYHLMLFPEEQKKRCNFDTHHRPISEDSWLVKNNQQKKPLIDIAANLLLDKLQELFPSLNLSLKTPFFEPTFDIDIAYAHKAKSLITHGLGTASLAVKGNISGLNHRIKVWRKKVTDPYDVFDIILEELEQSNLKAVFFAMTANRSKYDKNNHYQSKAYRNLLKRISENHVVGIHPGYRAAENPTIFEMEKKRLEDIINQQVTHVRQHYLRHFLPEMWHTYIKHGISHDYSIGYAVRDGFKVGTCSPYQAFDVNANEPLPIVIHPFALMDTAIWRYQQNNFQEVMGISNSIKSQLQESRSSLSAVWHNYAMPHHSVELSAFKQQIQLFGSHD